MPSPTKPLSLDEAYDIYKAGGHIGRTDLFAMIIGEVKDLKARIGAVDEAAVAALDNRVGSLETVIGNALAKTAVIDSGTGPAAVMLVDRQLKRRGRPPRHAETGITAPDMPEVA